MFAILSPAAELMDSLTAEHTFPVYLHEPSTGSIYEVLSLTSFKQYQYFKQDNCTMVSFRHMQSDSHQVKDLLFDKVGKIEKITKNNFEYRYHAFITMARRNMVRRYKIRKKRNMA